MNRINTTAFLVFGSAVAIAAQCFAATVTFFPGSTYDSNTSSMDAALGITGFVIEDFEDIDLAPGLSVTYVNPNAGPISTLPTVYNETLIGNYTNNLWDGDHALVNTPQNEEWNQPGVGVNSIADRVTFSVSGGARSIGVGLGNFQGNIVDHELLVNGVSVVAALESLPGWVSGVSVRNGYIRIDAEPGEAINSVSIDIGTGTRDGLIFDHLAFTPVPEPSTLSMILASCLLPLFAGKPRSRTMAGVIDRACKLRE